MTIRGAPAIGVAGVYGMVLAEDGFRQIADENAKNGTTFRVQFKDGVNIQEAMNEIKCNMTFQTAR